MFRTRCRSIPDLFDVVIFDEASQIPLEEAIPAIYRSHQVIIVGDEMQLPPTTFFASAAAARTKASWSRRKASASRWTWTRTAS